MDDQYCVFSVKVWLVFYVSALPKQLAQIHKICMNLGWLGSKRILGMNIVFQWTWNEDNSRWDILKWQYMYITGCVSKGIYNQGHSGEEI